ncbi:hypothetical protein LCGC14_0249670 [marine sediment metagenome]|uniref:Uncharacterized protein n=1 Tax=marine sediment metagenome TaxID=412755 RepID=A0A0F9U9V1_9ZZZZ
MRTITKNPAPETKKPVATVADMDRHNLFKVASYADWYGITDNHDWPVVNLRSHTLWPPDWLKRKVSEVLADGDSLTIGPEVKDGSASDV